MVGVGSAVTVHLRCGSRDDAPPPGERLPIIAAMQAAAAAPSRLSLYLDLIRWDRPAGWLLLLWPTLSALWIAADGWPGWHLLVVFVAGTVLMRSAGCCVNDVADRDFDRHVQRTAQRPVTRGAVSVREALMVGAVLALAAFALVLTTAPPAIWLSFVALAITLL
jgi:4-hydroxybenzoate polyprenyltransferase